MPQPEKFLSIAVPLRRNNYLYDIHERHKPMQNYERKPKKTMKEISKDSLGYATIYNIQIFSLNRVKVCNI